jgi:hypothetical protein
MAPLTLHLSTKWRWATSLMPPAALPPAKELLWIGGWVGLRDGQGVLIQRYLLPSPGIWTLNHPARSIVTIMTILSQLPLPIKCHNIVNESAISFMTGAGFRGTVNMSADKAVQTAWYTALWVGQQAALHRARLLCSWRCYGCYREQRNLQVSMSLNLFNLLTQAVFHAE